MIHAAKMKVKKDDIVKIVAGKEKGKKGKVLLAFSSERKIIVEKLNMIKRHTRPSTQNKQGGIIEKEAKIHVSNAMVVCDKCDTPVRVSIKSLENNKKVRICKKCGEIIGIE